MSYFYNLLIVASFISSVSAIANDYRVVCNPSECSASNCESPFGSPKCGGKRFYGCVPNQNQCADYGKTVSWKSLEANISAESISKLAGSYKPESTYSAPTSGDIQEKISALDKILSPQSDSERQQKIRQAIAQQGGAKPDANGEITQDEIKAELASMRKEREDLVAQLKETRQHEMEMARQAEQTSRDQDAAMQRQIDEQHNKDIADVKKHDYSYDAKRAAEASGGDDDECSVSSQLTDGRASCAGTRNTVTGAQITNFGTQLVGSISTQIVGAGAAQRAANSQTQSGALRAAASTQDTTAKMQMGVGALNSLLGITQFVQSRQHSGYSKEINSGTRKGESHIDSSGIQDTSKDMARNGKSTGQHGYFSANKDAAMADAAITKFNLNSEGKNLVAVDKSLLDRAQQIEASGNPNLQPEAQRLRQLYNAQVEKRKVEAGEKISGMGEAIRRIGQQGMSEQNKISKEAQAGGLMSFMTGAQQLVMGYFNKKGADQTKQAADQLAQAEQRAAMQAAAAFVPPRADSLASADALGARAPTAITGSGQNSAATDIQAQNQNPIDTTGTDGFGNSSNVENLNNTPSGAPTPGAFDTSKGGGGVAQGGGGFAPGGNTMANDQAGKEGPGATAYNDTAGKMEMGGGGRGAAYGGGGRGGGGENPSINPADMLAQLGKLMPGQEEQNKKNTSIESYINRSPAAAGAWVPQGESIFEHVSMAYRQQQKRRAVGI